MCIRDRYEMDKRLLLSAVDFESGTVTVEGKTYPMLDMNFPTIDPKNPLTLTKGEKELLKALDVYKRQDLNGETEPGRSSRPRSHFHCPSGIHRR